MRILSTLDGWSTIPGWRDRVDSVRLAWVERRGGLGALVTFVTETFNSVKLWWLSRRYEAVITDCRPHVALFGLFERLTFWSKRRHLVFECLWVNPAGPVHKGLKALQLRAILTPRSRGIVYARRERERFSACFGIPAERFVFIPYHTTLTEFAHPATCDPPRGRYVFAGGETHRDYKTLCEAVTGLDVRVVIAARDHNLFARFPIPANVEIVTTDHAGFLHWVLHASVNVVPLEKGTLRSAGQQTFLNAMALGTPVIVTDVEGGSDYIENWVNGVLVEPGDAAQLRHALVRLLNDRDLAVRIGASAAHVRDSHSTERVLNACLDFLVSERFADGSCAAFLGDSCQQHPLVPA
jgi:glycosyltransferase involved in cell wall biosynthesis